MDSARRIMIETDAAACIRRHQPFILAPCSPNHKLISNPRVLSQLTSYDVASTFHQSLGVVAGETCSTAGDCAAGFVCECGVLNPVVAVEIKVTLGGYTSLTFGDTEKDAFRQGLTSCDRETYPKSRESETLPRV